MNKPSYLFFILFIAIITFSVMDSSVLAYDLCQKEIVSMSAEFSETETIIYTVPEGKKLIITDICQSGRVAIDMTKFYHYAEVGSNSIVNVHLNSGIPYETGEQIIIRDVSSLTSEIRVFLSGYLIPID